MISKLRYGNSVIKYQIIKSKRRKTSEIRVDEKGVEVHTPLTKKDSEIQDIVDTKKQWIFKKQLEFADRKKRKFKTTVTLRELKANPDLTGMRVVQKGSRLSITPVTESEWHTVMDMAGVKVVGK